MAKAPAHLRSKARAHTDNAIQVLVEIMNERSAPHLARVSAATEILNRGLGKLVQPQKFGPVEQEFYVYSIHDSAGRVIYIGKGSGRRFLNSARRLNGRPRVRASFSNEQEALRFESRLIGRFKPPENRLLTGG